MKNKKLFRFEAIARTLAVVYIVAWVIYFLFQSTGGNFSSFRNLLPPVVMLLLMMVASQNAFIGGGALCIAGIAIAVRYGFLMDGFQWMYSFGTGGPYLLVGILYIVGGWQRRHS